MSKHIKNSNKDGSIEINKSSLGDIVELIRVSPTSARVLYTLANYADKDNSLISNINTLSLVLGEKKEVIKHSLCKLFRDGFIDIKKVQIDHKQDLFKFIHNKQIYDLSHGAIWRVIGTELVDTVTLDGTYNKFIVNPAIITCKATKENNILIHATGNLFYDTSVRSDEIIWED